MITKQPTTMKQTIIILSLILLFNIYPNPFSNELHIGNKLNTDDMIIDENGDILISKKMVKE